MSHKRAKAARSEMRHWFGLNYRLDLIAKLTKIPLRKVRREARRVGMLQ